MKQLQNLYIICAKILIKKDEKLTVTNKYNISFEQNLSEINTIGKNILGNISLK